MSVISIILVNCFNSKHLTNKCPFIRRIAATPSDDFFPIIARHESIRRFIIDAMSLTLEFCLKELGVMYLKDT